MKLATLMMFLAALAYKCSGICAAFQPAGLRYSTHCQCRYEIEDLKRYLGRGIDELRQLLRNGAGTRPPTQPVPPPTRPLPPPVPVQPGSCAQLKRGNPSAKSGYYSLLDTHGHKQRVFCRFESLPGCGDGSWRRVAYFDRSSMNCQGAFVDYAKRGCVNTGANCNKAEFQVEQEYTKVCGRVLGYRLSTVDGFSRYPPKPPLPISAPYLDGVSITYGSHDLKHLWSYATTNSLSTTWRYGSPCTSNIAKNLIPTFVGSNYYVEVGVRQGFTNLLWDGKNCDAREHACCSNPNLPWFTRTIPGTREPIQLRICTDESAGNERVIISLYEIYIQ